MKIVTVLSAPLLLTTTLLLMPAGDADAHRVGASWQSGYADRYYVPPRHHVVYPRWLVRNYDFRRWFEINYYYGRDGVSWKHLHKRYKRDQRWHGYGKRKQRRHYRAYVEHRDYRGDRRDKRKKRNKRRHRHGH